MPYKVIPTTGLQIYQVNFIFSDGVQGFSDFEINDMSELSDDLVETLDFLTEITKDLNPVEPEYDEPENDYPPGYDPSPSNEIEPSQPSPFSP
jgi:hypothetical protein